MTIGQPIPVFCRLSVESCEDLARIEQECNSPPWSCALFKSEFTNPCSSSYGMRLKGQLAAFLVCHAVMEEAHIVSFGVLRSFRRRKLGSQLMESVLRELYDNAIRTVTLEVRRSNVAALSLYERFCFSEVAVRKAYYTDNREDALVLRLEMSQFAHEFLNSARAVG